MYWRRPRIEFEASLGAANREAFHQRVCSGAPPGLLAYQDGDAVGWVQVGPRLDVPNWNGKRRLTAATPDAPAEDPCVWGVSCFAVKGSCRRRGIARALLLGAMGWARENDARSLDACPVDRSEKTSAASLYHGVASMFRNTGFVEISRRRADRPLMRLRLDR